jgi:hypothetical protein
VADMMRSASARFVERHFDPGLPQRVLWSNFRLLGFCNSSDFSSLLVGVEDFADYFANVPVSSVQILAVSYNFFRRRFILSGNRKDLDEMISALNEN